MSEKKGLGLIPSPKDPRDILMSGILPPFESPRKIDYTDQMTPVRDQGSEGTCVGFATAVGMKEYQEKKEHGNIIELSPRFLYQECKKIDEMPDKEGTTIKAAMQVLVKLGVCREEYWPYVPDVAGTPKPGAEENALKYRSIRTYTILDSINVMKRSLVTDGPFVAGVRVYDNWYDQSTHSTGKIPMPGNSSRVEGHAICIVGYNDDDQTFKFKNSWGIGFGEKGYGYLPYNYIENELIDAMTATDLISDPEFLVKAKEKVLNQLGISFGR